jgi:hypothetical protein
MKRIIVILILVIIASDLSAQYRRYRPRNKKCVICVASLGVGYYVPSLAYYKEETPYVTNVGENFGGALMYTGSLETQVIPSLFVGLGGGFWTTQDQVDTLGIGDALISETFRLSYLMGDLYARYEFDFSNPFSRGGFASIFHPYIGAGVSQYFMIQNFERTIIFASASTTINYNFTTYYPMAGATFDLPNKFAVQVEYRHIFGGYDQSFTAGDNIITENVSVQGPMAMVKVSYQFFSRQARDLMHKRRRGSRFGRRR